MSLCEEYKEQLKLIEKSIKEKSELNKKNISPIKYNLSNLNCLKNNLEFGIKWMSMGHEPGIYEGIDKTEVYKGVLT